MSLRKISGGRIGSDGFWIFRRWKFFYTKSSWFELPDSAYRQGRQQLESSGAARVGQDGDRVMWWTDSGLFWADVELTDEEVGLLLFDRERKREARFDRLRKIRAREEDLAATRRERIPDDVRAFVWERDEGRCVRCGAEDDLQFDHVIPVAKGGGAAVDNIQILCGDCNRRKSDSIA